VFDVHHKPYGPTSLSSCYFSQVHKVQHKHTKQKTWGNSTKFGAYKSWCSQWRTRHSLVCTGHCPVPRLEHLANWPLSIFLRAIPLKFTELSGEPIEQRWTSPNGRLRWLQTVEQSAEHKSEVSVQSQNTLDCPVCHRTIWCFMRTEDFNGQQLQTLTVGWRGNH
jgi:hypothetical protein